MNAYSPGSLVTLSVTFSDASGVAADPSTITLRVLDPLKHETDYSGGSITRASAGKYSAQVEVFTSGVWSYRWEGAGAVTAAKDAQFNVLPTPFINPQ